MYIPSTCLFSSAAIFSWIPKKVKPETWTFGVCFNLCLLNHWVNLKLLMITWLPRKRLWGLPFPKQIFWHLKIGRSPKGNSSSNHHFSGAMLVLGSVSWTTLHFEGQTSYSDLDHGSANRSMLTGGFKEISCSLVLGDYISDFTTFFEMGWNHQLVCEWGGKGNSVLWIKGLLFGVGREINCNALCLLGVSIHISHAWSLFVEGKSSKIRQNVITSCSRYMPRQAERLHLLYGILCLRTYASCFCR